MIAASLLDFISLIPASSKDHSEQLSDLFSFPSVASLNL